MKKPAICIRVSLLVFALLSAASFSGQGFTPLQEEIGLNQLYESRGHLGGGAVIIDINNDGFMDVYLPGGEASETLLLNMEGDSLVDISFESGIGVLNNSYTMGGVAGDLNKDGYEDLFITTWQFVETWGGPNYNIANKLMINNGDNTFYNGGGFAGILESSFSSSATLLDANTDGFLDIYVANYVDEVNLIYDGGNGQVIGFAHDCFSNFLYISSNGQEYDEMAELYGVDDAGCGLATAATDYNRDGITDLMVVNDFGEWVLPNKLYENTGSTYLDVTNATGTGAEIYGMGIAAGDFDEDGDMDYYMTNIGRNVLLRQEAEGVWSDVTDGAGVDNTYYGDKFATSWGANFFDYDNDSYLDLYVSNGHIPAAPFIATSQYDPNQLYHNNQDGTFTDITTEMNLLDTAMGRGSVIFDFNNDGKLDILQVNVYDQLNQAPNGTVLYLNETENDHNFVMFSLKGTTSNPHGIGARVELFANGRKLIREVDGGSSHASHNDKRVHFGLGTIFEIDTVLIYWPGISEPQMLLQPAINEIHEITQEDIVTRVTDVPAMVKRVFPNPTSDQLALEVNSKSTDEWTIRFSTLSGKMLRDGNFQPGANSLIRLDAWVEHLTPGMYLLTVSGQDGTETFRIAVID